MRKICVSFAALGLAMASCGDDSDSGTGGFDDAGTVRLDGGSEDVAPGAVSNFLASANSAGGINLAWVNPSDADLAGVVVVTSQDVPIDFEPSDGTAVVVGAVAGSPEQEVLSIDEVESLLHSVEVPGTQHNYAAWAFDDALNYSPIALTNGFSSALGLQQATLSVDLTTQIVSVTAGPSNLVISATAVYNDALGRLEVDTTLRNETNRLIFNLKGLSTSINQGDQSGARFPFSNGQPSTYFGPNALAVGAEATRTIELTNVDGSVNPITIDLDFVDAPMIYGGSYRLAGYDSSGSRESFRETGNLGNTGRQIAMSPDGHFLYVVTKGSTDVVALDTTTGLKVASADLSSNGLASGGGIAVSPDGSDVYVAFNNGAHYNGGDGNGNGDENTAPDLQVIKLNSDLEEQSRLTLYTGDRTGRTLKTIHVSPDASKLVAVLSSQAEQTSELWFVDLDTFSLIDADQVTAGAQPVYLPGPGYAEHAVWNPDGSSVYVANNNGKYKTDQKIIVSATDASTFVTTQLAEPTTDADIPGPLVINGAKLYVPARDNGESLSIYDLNSGTVESVDMGDGINATGVVFAPDRQRYFVTGRTGFAIFSAQTDERLDSDGDPGNGITDVPNSAPASFSGHMLAITPY